MIRFLHLADLHLGATLSVLGPLCAGQRQRDLQDALTRAVDYALEPGNAIHAVVIAGDLFDTATPPDAVVDHALHELGRLARGGLPVIIVPGNHDALDMPRSVYAQRAAEFGQVAHVAASPMPSLLSEETLNGSRVAFYGMAWQPHASQPPYDIFRATAPAKFHVAVLHATLEEGLCRDLHSRDVPVTLSRLAETGMDYVALGHIHSPQVHVIGRGMAVYPGTLEGLRLTRGETGQRYLTVVSLREGQLPQVDRIPWNKRTIALETLDLSALLPDSEDDLARFIREHLAGPDCIVRLTLRGTPPFVVNIDALRERLQDAFFALDLVDETDAFQSQQAQAWAQELTVRGLCMRQLQAELEAAPDDEARQRIELALKLLVRALSVSVRN